MIHVKRVYEPALKSDGERFLVDRMWPRGVSKEKLRMAAWLKDVAPSGDLRRWFNHEPAKWEEFRRRYREELNKKPQTLQPLVEAAQRGDVTLLFGARDLEHNNAVALKAYLEACSERA